MILSTYSYPFFHFLSVLPVDMLIIFILNRIAKMSSFVILVNLLE